MGQGLVLAVKATDALAALAFRDYQLEFLVKKGSRG
jgi:hypothetical protein